MLSIHLRKIKEHIMKINDVLASWSGYSVRKPSVPMIAILLSSSVGMSIE